MPLLADYAAARKLAVRCLPTIKFAFLIIFNELWLLQYLSDEEKKHKDEKVSEKNITIKVQLHLSAEIASILKQKLSNEGTKLCIYYIVQRMIQSTKPSMIIIVLP